MTISIEKIDEKSFTQYDLVPNHFRVESILEVEIVDSGLGGMQLKEKPIPQPYDKHFGLPGEDGPSSWAKRFDLSRWGIFLARENGNPIGGAAVAVGSPVYPIDKFQRKDLAVLWDLRAHPSMRDKGIGTKLFHAAAHWARQNGFGQLGMETQNINVPICRFLVKHGCKLGAIHRFGYAGCPNVAHEAMLLWYYDL
jgi:GNAT superfamily N-acetyltransferase